MQLITVSQHLVWYIQIAYFVQPAVQTPVLYFNTIIPQIILVKEK